MSGCHCGAVLVAWILLTALDQVEAAVINAQSVSLADVAAAIALANDGDIVTVPAGTATWTSTLTITKNITLQGSGAGSTVIVEEIVRTVPETPLIRAVTPTAGSFRISGFTFQGGTVNTQATFNGEIQISGECHAVRIDHCTFNNLNGVSLATCGFTLGVIDHNAFNTVSAHPIVILHETWQPFNGATPIGGGPYTFGHGSWADDPYWGSDRFVFIEDNIFVDTSEGGSGIDMFEGARAVVRHNAFTNVRLTNHGTEGQGRGAKQIEEYNNTFTTPVRGPVGQLRSGAIISFDNAYNNFAQGHLLHVFRQDNWKDNWGWSNGQSVYDDNDPHPTNGYWETGTHTGGMNASSLTDSTKNWTTDQWYVPGASYILRNLTKYADQPESGKLQSFITSNTATTITCQPTPLRFDTGDTYQIWKVVHSLDQPGQGRDDGTMNNLPGVPAHWPSSATEPCYAWRNTWPLTTNQGSIKEGRDFFNGTPKPGYTPYTYPHPLVISRPPGAPTNLRVGP